MGGHVPPPGADRAVKRAAEAYVVAVQEALGTTHKLSVATIALVAVLKHAARFEVNEVELWLAVAKLLRR